MLLMTKNMTMVKTLFFDLDDTLYASTTGVWELIRQRMGWYMQERLGMAPDVIPDLRHQYYLRYGTTLRGLQAHHQVDADDFLAYVHDIPLQDYLQPDPEVKEMLLSLSHPRWVFTNADDAHARRVLQILDLAECFCGVVDLRAMQFLCKPEEGAYRRAMALAGESDPRSCLLVDDSASNLEGAHRLGFTTVLVASNKDLPENGHRHRHSNPAVDYHIRRLLELPQAMPQLWR